MKSKSLCYFLQQCSWTSRYAFITVNFPDRKFKKKLIDAARRETRLYFLSLHSSVLTDQLQTVRRTSRKRDAENSSVFHRVEQFCCVQLSKTIAIASHFSSRCCKKWLSSSLNSAHIVYNADVLDVTCRHQSFQNRCTQASCSTLSQTQLRLYQICPYSFVIIQ